MPLGLILTLATAAVAASAAPSPEVLVLAQRRPLPGAIVPDAVLATMRGGVRLPNGLDLALGIDIQTWIDGQLALRTVYASEGASTGIRVYTDSNNPVASAPTLQTVNAGQVIGTPLLVVDRSPTGTTILPATATAVAPTVNLVHGDPATWLSGQGEQQVPVTSNGPAVAAPPGSISLTSGNTGAVVTLQAPSLEVQQLIGQASGVIVANTANNRTIDTMSSVNVDLRGLSSGLLAAGFAAQRVISDTVIAR